MMQTSRVSAPAPIGSRRRPRAFDGAAARHGRHTNAQPAPSRRPLVRVKVARYRVLSEAWPWSAAISTISPKAPPMKNTPRARSLPAAEHHRPDEDDGPERYHCSSTASDQRWRSSGGSAETKYGRLADDLAPVAGVEDRPRQVSAERRSLLGRPEQGGPHGDGDQHREQRRQQPAGAPQPELLEARPVAWSPARR